MAHPSDSTDDAFVAHFKARAVGLVTEAKTDEPRGRRYACLGLGTMKYDAEHATRDADSRTLDECALYDASSAVLPITNAFIDTANEDQLRYVFEGMLHGQHVKNLLQKPSTPQVGQKNDADGDTEVVRIGPLTSSLPSAMVMADVTADFTQTRDVETTLCAAVAVGIIKHRAVQDCRCSDSMNDDHHEDFAVEAARTLSDIDSLIAQADANRLRAIISGFTRSMHT